MAKRGRVRPRTVFTAFGAWVVWCMGSMWIWERTRMDIDVYRDLILISLAVGFLVMHGLIGMVVADRRETRHDPVRRQHRSPGWYLSRMPMAVDRLFASRINPPHPRAGSHARRDAGSPTTQALAERILSRKDLRADSFMSTLNSWNSQ